MPRPCTIESLEIRQHLSASLARQATSDASTSSRRVVGYLPEYRFTSLNRIDFTALTHINYFSITATTTGGLSTGNVNLSHLATARDKAHAAGVKMSITVGPQTFSTLSSNTTSLNTFVTNMIGYVEDNDLDGIDIDWEPPASNSTDKARYGQLIDALYAQTKPRGLVLSAAVNPINTEIPVAQANKLDWINIMGYDFDPANHSPYTSSVNSLVRWSNYGVAKDKLVLGVPFYGRKGTTWSNTVSRTYGALVDDYAAANGGAYPGGAFDSFNGYYFNGPNTIASKGQYVLDNNYGGVMIWELGQDHWTSSGVYSSQSLLPVIKNVIQPTQPTYINRPDLSPATESTANANEARSIAVNVSAYVKSAGVMQVELLRADGSVASRDYHVVGAATQTYAHTFNVSITESSPATRDYSVVVRFRSGATTGPLLSAASTDLVAISLYRIIWEGPRDAFPPAVAAKTYVFEINRRVQFSFNESVYGSVSASDVVLRRVGDSTPIAVTGFGYDLATNSATFNVPAGLADGDYTATLVAGSVQDAAGNVLTDDETLDFFILAGDVNRDRSVDFTDLVILAQNYGQMGRTFSQGNIDYSVSGNVDFSDLVILAQHYNSRLPNVVLAPPPALVVAPGGKSRRGAPDVIA